MGVCHRVEAAFDVGLHHPLGAFPRNDLRYPSPRIVCAAARAKAIGAVPELRLLNGLQDQAQPILDPALLNAGHAERAVASSPRGDVDPP